MLALIFANISVRPFRTLISMVGVALGVILVVLFTGLAKGMTNDMAKRAANWKAEIVFTRPGGMDPTSSNAAVDMRYIERLEEIDGVEKAIPVLRYVSADTRGRWGVRQLDGVRWDEFAAMNGMSLVEGRAPTASDEVILDERQMADDGLKLGDNYELFGGKQYRVVGVFQPPSGSRIKMSLESLQEMLSTNKCTYILVKVKSGLDANTVAARINEELPGNKINLTQELIIDAQERIPGLSSFLRVLVLLGAFVSMIFVLLSMYTTITERRKEIGILKSLGASRRFIITTIEGEAFLIGVAGVAIGLVASFVISQVIGERFALAFEFSVDWILIAMAIAIGGSLIGAFYPAWRAAGIDPVEVMINE